MASSSSNRWGATSEMARSCHRKRQITSCSQSGTWGRGQCCVRRASESASRPRQAIWRAHDTLFVKPRAVGKRVALAYGSRLNEKGPISLADRVSLLQVLEHLTARFFALAALFRALPHLLIIVLRTFLAASA